MFNYFKDIFDKNVSQEFRFKNINETRNYFVKEIDKNQLMKKSIKRFVQLWIILTTLLF